MTPWVCAIGLLVWIGLLVETSLRGEARLDRRALVGALATFTLAFVARYVFVTPTFVHANFHGASLVDSVLEFPSYATHRREYGPVGFAWLGAIAMIFGDTYETIRTTNCVFSAISVTYSALFARSTSGRDSVGIAAAAAGIGAIPLLRIASSEDVHNVGLALASVGLYSLDRYLVTGAKRALLLSTVSLVAMLYARQTFFVLVPAVLICAYGRDGRSLVERPAVVDGALVVAVVALSRLFGSVTAADDSTTYHFLWKIVRMPGFGIAALGEHPLLDVGRFGWLPTCLLLVGVVHGAVASKPTRAVVVSFALAFAVTLPFGFPTPGVELGFRLPALLLGTVVVGFGGGFVIDRLAATRSGRRVPLAVALGVAAITCVAPLTGSERAALRRSSPDFVEYQFLGRHLDVLPRGAELVMLELGAAAPAYKASMRTLATRSDVHVVTRPRAEAAGRTYFLAGVQCWGYSFEEFGPREVRRGADPTPAAMAHVVPALFGGRWRESGLQPPTTMRPECVRLLRGSVAVGPQRIVSHPMNDIPFVIYGSASFTIGFHRLAASAP